MPSQIIGTGIALPKRTITSEELAGRLGLSQREIEKRTGIQSRHWVEAGETTSSLAVEAARNALQSADLSPDAIDLIIVSTTSPICLSLDGLSGSEGAFDPADSGIGPECLL